MILIVIEPSVIGLEGSQAWLSAGRWLGAFGVAAARKVAGLERITG